MAGGSPKQFLRGVPWAALMLASVTHAASDNHRTGGAAPTATPATHMAKMVMPAAYYGMAEAARGDSLLRTVMLDAHNAERASLGLSPLEWDDALAADAARHAGDMARTGLFRHSARAGRAIPSGENLWMGPRHLYGYDAMAGAFLDEKRLTRINGKLPDLSSTGRWQDVGHYTQMIWRGTRKLGCALRDGPQNEYLVCRYFPAGNIFGKGPLDADDTPIPAGERQMARVTP